jgi:hypothetical protein
MKGSRKVLFAGLLGLSMLLVIGSSCKKKRAFNEEDAQDTVDARLAQGECDEIVKDVNTVIMEQFLLRGKSAESQGSPGTSTTSICGVSLDTTGLTGGVITINYLGTNCYGRIRSGSVKFSILGYPLKKWKHQGCTLRIEYNNYKLTRVNDGKGVTLQGTQTLVNESGNTWFELWYLNSAPLVYHLKGDGLRVTFENEDYAKLNMSRRMTFTATNYVTTCKAEGTGSADGKSNLELWGQARKGESFYSEILTPVVWKTSCGSNAPIAGETLMSVSGKEHQLHCYFAVDTEGNDASGTDTPCPFGWKVIWKYKKKTKNRVFSYY